MNAPFEPIRPHVLKTQDQGFCVWLTGLSGAGKSTIAERLEARLTERGRIVTVLDGDVVRTNLSQGLGFSKADRDTNIRRIGFVAAEIVRHGGAVIVAAVSPYEDARREARNLVGSEHFVLAYVSTPLAICEMRDVKALYARARRGELPGLTGVDDPYEEPASPDIALETQLPTADGNAAQIERLLVERGLLSEDRTAVRRPAFPRRVA